MRSEKDGIGLLAKLEKIIYVLLFFCHRTNLKAFKLCNFAALLVTVKKN